MQVCLPVTEVTKLVFQALLDPVYESGAIVDGYPRTKTQVDTKSQSLLSELRSKYLGTLQENAVPKAQISYHYAFY